MEITNVEIPVRVDLIQLTRAHLLTTGCNEASTSPKKQRFGHLGIDYDLF